MFWSLSGRPLFSIRGYLYKVERSAGNDVTILSVAHLGRWDPTDQHLHHDMRDPFAELAPDAKGAADLKDLPCPVVACSYPIEVAQPRAVEPFVPAGHPTAYFNGPSLECIRGLARK